MKTLKLFSFIACMILCGMTFNSFSQDVILLSNGNEIEAKIIKVGNSEIEYKKWSNQDGPTFTEQKNNIFMIKYQNGEKDVFNQLIKDENQIASESNAVIKPQSTNENKTTSINVKNKSENKIFFGINAGVGPNIIDGYNSYYRELYTYLSLSATLGVDLAFPIGDVFAVGPYFSAGFDAEDLATIFGAWTMFRFKNNAAIMVGGGANVLPGYGDWGFSARLGFKFSNRIYLFEEITTISSYSYHSSGSWNDSYSFLIHLGIKLF